MTIRYPISNEVRNALQRFPRIAERIGGELPESGRSELEIVRLLGNTHYGHIDALLTSLNNHLPESGSIGKRALEQTDPLPFHHALSEFYLLAHLQNAVGIPHASAVSDRSGTSEKRYDIDLAAGESHVRVEVYCPADFFGYQLIRRYLPAMFRYLEIDAGFEISLRLERKNDDPFFAFDIDHVTDIRQWLDDVQAEAKQWIPDAKAGDRRRFEGPVESLLLSVTLERAHEKADWRWVNFDSPGQSSDTRLFFEMGAPENTARGPWGRKLLRKLQKRQCGAPSPGYLRLLVVDFSLADTGWPEFICWPDTAKRLAATLKLLIEEAGDPLPYDAVLPAQLEPECGFGEVIPLNPGRARETKKAIKAAGLDRPSNPPDAGDPKERMEKTGRFPASRPTRTHANGATDPAGRNMNEDPELQDLIDSISALRP